MKVKTAILVLSLVIFAYLTFLVATSNLRILVVLSGSMTPFFYPGDVIIVEKASPESVTVGDVITFKDPSGRENVLITHRVVKIEDDAFRTKGDAVDEEDQFLVNGGDVIGKPILAIPKLGYFLDEFKKGSTILYVTFILIPSILLISSEVRNLLNYREGIERREERAKILKDRIAREFRVKRFVALFLLCSSISLLIFATLPESSSNYPLDIVEFTKEAPYYRIANGSVTSEHFTPAYMSVANLVALYKIHPDLPLALFVLSPYSLLFLYPIYLTRSKRFYRNKII